MKTLLAIGVLIGLGTVIATVIIGSRLSERTVVPDPYEAGLRWDAEQRERRDVAWKVTIPTKHFPAGKQDIIIMVAAQDGRPLQDARVHVRFIRPFARLSEHDIRAEMLQQGHYRISADLGGPGRWDMVITVVQGERSMTFEGSVTVVEEGADAGSQITKDRLPR